MRSDQYNPLEKHNLARSIVEALFAKTPRLLTETDDLVGAGIYAIYYTGDFPAYQVISERNAGNAFGQPIYVGKAIPKGGRKGGLGLDAGIGRALRERIGIHAKSIEPVENLRLDDFFYRALVVDDIWIPLGENAVIEWCKPVWNLALDGFGIKDPGSGRQGQKMSDWDVMHPGRSYVQGLAASGRTAEDLIAKVQEFLRNQLPPSV